MLPDGNDSVPLNFSGEVEVGTRVLLAESPSAGWRLSVEDRGSAPRESAFGLANAWDVEVGGSARLSYRSPVWQWGVIAVQLAMWVLAARWVWQAWSSRRSTRRAAAKASA